MPYVLIIHEVQDYAVWKVIFDRATGIRKAAGEVSYQLLKYDTDANNAGTGSEYSGDNDDSGKSE